MVYVDDRRRFRAGPDFYRETTCIMAADTHDELVAMIKLIFHDPHWIVKSGTYHEYININRPRRVLAIAAGAKVITRREMSTFFRVRRPAKKSASSTFHSGIDDYGVR